MNRPAPGFHALHANHLEDLKTLVLAIRRSAPVAPLAEEVFLVQNNGMAQWLKMSLADRCGPDEPPGIAAGFRFQLPQTFIWEATRQLMPARQLPSSTLFDRSSLTWRIYRLLPSLCTPTQATGSGVGAVRADEADSDRFAPLRGFLDADRSGEIEARRRFQLAEKLADLFDEYLVFRADWLTHWASGGDGLPGAGGHTHELAADQRWQPALWRRLIDDAAGPEDGVEATPLHRAAIHDALMALSRQSERPQGADRLPPRVYVFGISVLPRQVLEALHALSHFTQIVFCQLNPCEYHWSDALGERELLASHRRNKKKASPERRALDSETETETETAQSHPLLAAWGGQGRDMMRLLDDFDRPGSYSASFLQSAGERLESFSPSSASEGRPSGLLHQIQNDIRELKSAVELRAELAAGSRILDAGDQTLVFHSAHSALREVEVLHDQLLDALETDPTLQAREIIVLVPDIEQFAPRIDAVFGRHATLPSAGLAQADDRLRFIPYHISDRSPRQQPLMVAIEDLLALPQSRFAASEVFALLEVPAVQRRFNLQAGDLSLIEQWIAQSGIRWGFDAEQRAQEGLPSNLHANTWQRGIRSLFTGYLMGQDSEWKGIYASAAIGGLEAGLAGKLDTFIWTLDAQRRQLSRAQKAGEWVETIKALVAACLMPDSQEEHLLVERLLQEVSHSAETIQTAGLEDQPLPLEVVREVWLAGLEQATLQRRFMAGGVTFASMMPMRAIPFRMVCLLGMNDGEYPRSRPPSDFNLMARYPRAGDRSRREDDRYLFLEALLSARDRLYVSWVGRNIRSDTEQPASVLVAQLQDHIDLYWSGKTLVSRAAPRTVAPSQWLTTEHPLQPFSPRYFRGEPKLFTYAREWRHTLEVPDRTTPRDPPIDVALPPPELPLERPLDLSSLARFLRNPVEVFYKNRLSVYFDQSEDLLDDTEVFSLDPLGKSALYRSLLSAAAAAGAAPDTAVDQALEILRGRGQLGMHATADYLGTALKDEGLEQAERYRNLLASLSHHETVDQVFTAAIPAVPGADSPVLAVADRLSLLCPLTSGSTDADIDSRADSGADSGSGSEAGTAPVKARSCMIVQLSASKLPDTANETNYAYGNLLVHWIRHLAAHALGWSCETWLVGPGKAQQVQLTPLKAPAGQPVKDYAMRLITQIVQAWYQGQQTPLPFEIQTALVWVQSRRPFNPDTGDFSEVNVPVEALQEALGAASSFDAGYLRACHDRLSHGWISGELAHWADRLFRPMVEHCTLNAKMEGRA